MKTLATLPIKNKRVFLRLDLNVPLQKGIIRDSFRITTALPTIAAIKQRGPKQIIMGSHLGRPGGEANAAFSLAVVAKRLAKELGEDVYFHKDITQPIPEGHFLVLLENLRFWSGEQNGSNAFAKQLAAHADVYVNDAFGTAHRKDASVYALAKLLPHAGGPLMTKEIRNLHLRQKRPSFAIFGAAKIHDKLDLLETILRKTDKVLIGGAVMFTFLRALEIPTGTSLVEEDMLAQAKRLYDTYSAKIVLPVDVVVASKKTLVAKTLTERKHASSVVAIDKIPARKAGFDVGPKTIQLFCAQLQHAGSVVWNGPLGVAEVKPYDASTLQLAKYLAEHTIKTIVCGGDTAAAIRATPYADKMNHISTGGGASLLLLGGNKLPAVEVLH